MKRIVAGGLAMALALTSIAAAQDDSQHVSSKLIPSITVIGTGEVNSKPDMATINIGVTTEAESAADALKANTEKMNRLMEDLKRTGIDDKDIQTSNFSVHPRYDHDPEGRRAPKINGYQVNNQVQVKVRKLNSLGRLLDDVISSGANNVQGIEFSLADSTNAMDDARTKAMADARRKAELYAKAAELKLGKPMLIQEQITRGGPQPMPYARMAMAAEAVPVAAGELTTSAQITVTYRIVEDKSDDSEK
jgi:uncharacterized protein YggE